MHDQTYSNLHTPLQSIPLWWWWWWWGGVSAKCTHAPLNPATHFTFPKNLAPHTGLSHSFFPFLYCLSKHTPVTSLRSHFQASKPFFNHLFLKVNYFYCFVFMWSFVALCTMSLFEDGQQGAAEKREHFLTSVDEPLASPATAEDLLMFPWSHSLTGFF